MKNRKLYESIQKLVTSSGKQYKKKSKEDFAHQYCSQQLKKKKLIPKSKSQKIDHLMKNFKNIKTYIEVDDLIKCVNDQYAEQQKSKKEHIQKRLKTEKIMTHTRFLSENIQPSVLNKAKQTLKEHRKNTYEAENTTLKQVIGIFEENSNYLCQAMRNQINNRFVTQITDIDKSRKNDDMRDSTQSENKQKWNNYSRSNMCTKTEPNQKSRYYYENIKQKPFQNHKKKNKMFELAQIYLQIILEQEHRKKWSKNNDFKVAAPEIKEKSIQRKWKILRSSILNKDTTPDAKSSYSISKMPTVNNFENSTNSTYHFLRSRSRNNTRVRREKDIAIKKLNNFLFDLEEDENCLKNEKRLHLCQLSRLEKHFDQEDDFRTFRIWGDDQKCQQIKTALHRQDAR